MENHTSKTYQERMNQTATSKFGVIQPHLKTGIKLLDFGSGYSPEFIGQVKNAGAEYVAYDVSPTVQGQLQENNVDFLTKEQLLQVESEFDIVYLSSVFHELMSYLTRQERTEVFAIIDKTLKSDGKIIIRDWGYSEKRYSEEQIIIHSWDYATRKKYSLQLTTNEVEEEVHSWVTELVKNSVIRKPWLFLGIDGKPVSPNIYIPTSSHDIYEIMFHVVWGLDSIEREAKETYTVTPELIEKWICDPLGYHIEEVSKEVDDTYLPYLQKYFKMDEIPWPTKIIYVLKKASDK